MRIEQSETFYFSLKELSIIEFYENILQGIVNASKNPETRKNARDLLDHHYRFMDEIYFEADGAEEGK